MINVCIASVPDREEMLKETIKSLLPQVNSIHICLNGYDKDAVQKLSTDPKIHCTLSNNKYGDAGKFLVVAGLKGYNITCDDDLIFPPDFIWQITSGIDRYEKKAVVSFHGRIMNFPINSYYNGHLHYLPFHKELKHDTPCHVIGTGCMGWHSDTLDISMDQFPSPNMADIHFSVFAKQRDIPLIVLAHRSNWIGYMQPEKTIYSQMKDNDKEQVERLNTVKNWI